MRLNCAPRRFFLTKENGVLLCIRELRGFSILLRPRQNHFKTSCFPVFCLWRKRLIQSRCLLSSSSPSGQRLGPIPWATVTVPTTNTYERYGFPCLANACSVSLIYVPTPYSAHFTMPNLYHFIFRSYILPCKVYSHIAKLIMPKRT